MYVRCEGGICSEIQVQHTHAALCSFPLNLELQLLNFLPLHSASQHPSRVEHSAPASAFLLVSAPLPRRQASYSRGSCLGCSLLHSSRNSEDIDFNNIEDLKYLRSEQSTYNFTLKYVLNPFSTFIVTAFLIRNCRLSLLCSG